MNGIGRVIAAVVVAGIAGAYGVALERLRRFERGRGGARRWWFGYARDAVNLATAVVAWCALRVGFDGPTALVLTVALVLPLYLLDWTFGRALATPRLRRAAIALLAASAAAAELAAPRLGPIFDDLVAAVSPR